MNPTVKAVTDRIRARSQDTRSQYIERMQAAHVEGVQRERLSCGNLAHGFAVQTDEEKQQLSQYEKPNLGIVTSYNDMLSAHQPYKNYPDQIKQAAWEKGVTAQVAGATAAMCDGVTQGQSGMELSLFSRDNIAMSTAVALSHNMFDGVLGLAICDKIVPGMLMGALRFGHLPMAFVPAGPMPSGIPNDEKSRVRKAFQSGEVGRDELLKAESASYHSAGTCTFFGTANSNQMLLEMMGLQLPGASFVNPDTDLRKALTKEITHIVASRSAKQIEYLPLYEIVDEAAIVNAMIGLMATGGSTNHTIHLIAIAKAAGIQINWQDMSDLSNVIPLLAKVYPNGSADVNHFHAAGGMNLVIHSLLSKGLLNEEVNTIVGPGMHRYTMEPILDNGKIEWREGPKKSLDENVVASPDKAFSDEGGLKILKGNLGRSVIKTSAVADEHRVLEAPAKIFHTQKALKDAFENGELEQDFIAVIRFQGPKANGMPELHQLTPVLGVLQDRGFKVAIVTDGRMSGASGKVPAAIHMSPEVLDGGAIGKVREGDVIKMDTYSGELNALVNDDEWNQREIVTEDLLNNSWGMGRELFTVFRDKVSSAEEGASVFDY